MNSIEELKTLINDKITNSFEIQRKMRISFSSLCDLLLDNLIIDESFEGINNHLLDIKRLRIENCDAAKIESKLSLTFYELATVLLEYLIINGDKVLGDFNEFQLSKKQDNTLNKPLTDNSENIEDELDNNVVPKIVLKNIDYRVKEKHILKDVSFEIKPGTFHAFVGENGAGKSTTISVIVGLINKFSGELLINDIDVKYKDNLRDGIVFVPDQTAFPTNFTVNAYLYHLTKLMTNLSSGQINTDIDYYLDKFSITEIKNRNANRCSAGQKQKLLLISALIQHPKAIVLDEPFANLDPSSRYLFMEELKEYQLKNNATIFLSTHILDEIKEYADHVTFLKKGKVLLTKEVSDNNEITELYKEYYLIRDIAND